MSVFGFGAQTIGWISNKFDISMGRVGNLEILFLG